MANYQIKDGKYLVICAWCDHFVDEDNNPTMLALRIHETLGLELTHGVCNKCKAKLENELAMLKEEKRFNLG